MQKLCDDKSKKVDPLHQMDLLWNIDDTDYTLFCDIGSAFAECYLIDVPIPVQDLLESCFLFDIGDVELNMYWLECIYMFKESDNSPLKKIENDPKVLELQLRMQMDQISLSKAKMRAQSQYRTQSHAECAASETSPENDCKASHSPMRPIEKVGLARATVAAKKTPTLVVTTGVKSTSPVLSAAAKSLAESELALRCLDDDCNNHEKCDNGADGQDNGAQIADAVKIAVKQKLNQ